MRPVILAAILAVTLMCVTIQAFGWDARLFAWLQARMGRNDGAYIVLWVVAFSLYSLVNACGLWGRLWLLS